MAKNNNNEKAIKESNYTSSYAINQFDWKCKYLTYEKMHFFQCK